MMGVTTWVQLATTVTRQTRCFSNRTGEHHETLCLADAQNNSVVTLSAGVGKHNNMKQ